MERAKRIATATAVMGVAFAASCCELTVAQPPNRFIRQPAKAPTNPAPVKLAPASPAPTATTTEAQTAPAQTPGTKNTSSVAPAQIAQPQIAQPQVAQLLAADALVADALVGPTAQLEPVRLELTIESDLVTEAAKPTMTEPKSVGSDAVSQFGFPSLLTLADSPDLEFDPLKSLATVPAKVSEKPTAVDFNSSVPADEVHSRTLTPPTQPSTPNSIRSVEPRATPLQWVSRVGGGQSRSEQHNLYATSQPQLDTNSARITLTSNTASNAKTQPSYTPYDLQSVSAAKQQNDSTNEIINQIVNRVDAIESKFEKADEPAKKDRKLASLVSARITNDPRFTPQLPVQNAVTQIESPQGWQAIGKRLSDHVTKCESLLRRGAFCSAREEAEMASLLLFRHIDQHDNLFRCEPAVYAANQALREAEDFVVALRSTSDGESLRRLVDAHRTPVLKNNNLTGMSPLVAAQHYRKFAEYQLTEAAQGHPWASELLYTVGRTYQSEADADNNRVDVLRMKAMAYYRASRNTMPSNVIACNQLGYLLLQMDRNEEAREALVAAVTLKADVTSLSNLAEASRRLGDTQTAAWAAQSVAAIRSRTPTPSPVPPVIEVPQEDFIAISPREIGPKTQSESSSSRPNQPAGRTTSAPNAIHLR